MIRQSLKSPRAAVRRAAARRFLGSLGGDRPFLVVGPTRHAADRLVHEAAEARGRESGFFGAFRYGLFVLAQRLARPELAARGLGALTPTARRAAVVRVLHRAGREGRLGRFEEAAEGPGLAARLGRTFGELRLAGIAAERVAERDAVLGALFAAYLEALAEVGLADRAETFAAGRRAIEEGGAGLPVGLPLVLLDAPLPDRAARRFAGALVAASPRVLLTLPEGDRSAEAAAAAFGAVPLDTEPGAGPETEEAPPETQPADDAVAAAQRHLFTPRRPDALVERRGLSVIAAPGAAAEAIEHVRVFLAEAAEGTRFDRMAVLLSDPASQAPAFFEAFQRAGAPAFFEAGARRPHPAGRAFLILLDCAREGLRASRFAEYLSLGETPAPADHAPDKPSGNQRPPDGPGNEAAREAGDGVGPPAAETSPAADPEKERLAYAAPRRWERLILDSEVIGGLDRWERRLARFAERLERDQQAEADPGRREHLKLRSRDLARLTATALPILRRLAALPKAPAPYAVWRRHLEELARAALLHPEGVLECLGETDPMRDVDEMSLEELRDSLAGRLAQVVVRSPGGRYGRVWVGPIEAARGLAFEVVAVPGLAERAFPRVLREDPMLLDRQRRALSPELPVRADLRDRERLRLRIAVGAATRRLVLSYSSLNLVEGRPQVPSYYLAETFRAGLGRVPTLGGIQAQAAEESRVARGIRAPLDPTFALDRREFDLARVTGFLHRPEAPAPEPGAAAYLLADPALARALRQEYMRQQRKWQSTDGFLHAGPAALEALAKHRPGARSWSATGLESYSDCPYQFFLKNVIRLRPVERPEALVLLDPLTRGSFLHDVFFHLGRELRERDLMPLPTNRLGEAFAVMERIFWRVEAEVSDRVAPAIPRIWRDQMDGLLGDLRGYLQRFAGSGRTTIANELTFGMEARQPADPASRPEPAVLPGGLRLHGAMDAVEQLPGGRVQVTDYKTGKASTRSGAEKAVLFGGRVLQPLLYALAWEAISGTPASSGQLYYATLRGGYHETVVKAQGEVPRSAFENFVADLDRAIRNGRFPALPNPDVPYRVCRYCDYLPVCGPRPAAHAQTKPPSRHTAALEEVVRIRSLP